MDNKNLFWEKIIRPLFIKTIFYNEESKENILKKLRNKKFIDLTNETIYMSKKINNLISEYCSKKLNKKINLDEVYINSLFKKAETIKNKTKLDKDTKIIAYNIYKQITGNEICNIIDAYKDEIIEYNIKRVNKIKSSKIFKRDILPSLKRSIESKTARDELKSRYSNSRDDTGKQGKDEIDFYMMYLATNDTFKLIQSDILLISEPLKALLVDTKNYIDKKDLLKLRIRQPIMESYMNNKNNKVEVNSLTDYLFVRIHKWLINHMLIKDYRKKVTKNDSLLFKMKLDAYIDLYNSLLRETIYESEK